jgi:translation initiation factor 2B subunit (eIF-2B alpha/beta/delta family)
MIAELAHLHKIPLYIIADSWKFSKKKVPIENRSLNEVWNHAPKKVKIENPAFEFVPKKYITGIVTELGLMKYDEFVKKN